MKTKLFVICLLTFVSLIGLSQKDPLKILKTTDEMTGVIHYEANNLIVCKDSGDTQTITTSLLMGKKELDEKKKSKKNSDNNKGLNVSGVFVNTKGFLSSEHTTIIFLLTNGERIILYSLFTKRENSLFSLSKEQLLKLKTVPVKKIMFESGDDKKLYRIYGTLTPEEQNYYINLIELAENWVE